MILENIRKELEGGKLSETCLYSSSNILQSYYDEVEQDLYITFSRGGNVYVYKGVSFEDYVWFRDNPSQGKTLRERLAKYKYEAINVLSKNELDEILLKQKNLMK